MHARRVSTSGHPVPSHLAITVQTIAILVPTVILLIGCLLSNDEPRYLLWLGTAVQVLICSLLFVSGRAWRQPVGPPMITVYLIALSWLWLGGASLVEWYNRLAQAILLLVPLVVFALQTLTDSGALTYRRARLLAQQLGNRKDWPAGLTDCRGLPEVKALREALQIDATPALDLLRHAMPQARMAALAALEFRKTWGPGQADVVLQYARKEQEPALRAAAVMALGNLDDRGKVELLADFLCDAAPEVRRAAAEALLWDTETRWPWIRVAVRRALSNSDFMSDGPLQASGQLLKPEVLADLTAWAVEKGSVSYRAAMTLAAHYNRALHEQPTPALLQQLEQQLCDPRTPPALRVELAQMLRSHEALRLEVVEKLLESANPAPLRLLAAEVLLEKGTHPSAVTTLREIARLPNRELALSTANVVQRRLGVDLGLALGQPLPPLHSRQAAEVTRRVMQWAEQFEPATRRP